MMNEKAITQRISDTVEIQGRKKIVMAKYLGYKGSTQSKVNCIAYILSGKKILTTDLINKISEFLLVPVGFFLFGEKNSPLQQIDEDIIIQKIKLLFENESKSKKIGRKKYQLGEALGSGGDDTAKIQTVNRTLQKKRKINIRELLIIADFFGKPLKWFLEDEGTLK